MSGFVDLHCHLLWGVDDGAKTREESVEMARALVDLGFSQVAASPHHRPEYADRSVALERLQDVQAALDDAGIALKLHENAENFFLDENLLPGLSGPSARKVGQGNYLLVEAPYTTPLPSLPDMVFRMKLKGVTPLIAHPERCMEFARKGRAAELRSLGACLQLDIGSVIGRYGPEAKKLARQFLEEGLYAVGATDLHGPVGAREWLGKSLRELRAVVGESAFLALMKTHPERIVRGETLES